MKPYSPDLRARVLADCDSGVPTSEVAAKFSVSPAWVRRLKQRARALPPGSVPVARTTTGRKAILAPHEERLRKLVADDPDATLAELRTRLGVQVSIGALHNYLVRMRLSFKKKALRAAERGRPDVGEAREEWAEAAPLLDPARLVFIDETSANTKMTRSHGRCPVGERLEASVPFGRWRTTTYVAALRDGGLVAPMVVDGAVNGDLFVAYVRQVLVPTLRVGDVVVMDNLSCHKRPEVADAVEAAGACVVYLPPYSPDLNPIEMAFAKVKARLRAEEIREVAGVEDFLGRVIDEFSPRECSNYIRHCGYGRLPAAPMMKVL